MGALEASKTKEQALSLLLSEPNQTQWRPNSAGLHSEEGTSALGEKGSSGTKHAVYEERDAEMENEITQEITGDAFADYDIDITKEGEALKGVFSLVKFCLI